jgi:hypothetical protein
MKKGMLLVIVLLFPIAAISAEETIAVQFGKMIDEIYNSQPSTWAKEVRQAKIKEMDKFWDLVKSNPNQYLDLLRKELLDPGNNPLFFIDGAMLLLEISSEKPDMLLAVDAMSRTNLGDLDHTTYLHQVHDLACKNIDVFPAVENMLNTPAFKVYLAMHALRLGQDYSVLFCTLNMDDDLYVDRFAQRLKTETDPVTIKTIVLSLAYTVSARGQQAISDFAAACPNRELKEYAVEYSTFEDKKKLPAKNTTSKREYFDRFLNDFANGEHNPSGYNWRQYSQEACYLVRKSDYAHIKELRRNSARRINDEAQEEIEYLTWLLQYSFTSAE